MEKPWKQSPSEELDESDDVDMAWSMVARGRCGRAASVRLLQNGFRVSVAALGDYGDSESASFCPRRP